MKIKQRQKLCYNCEGEADLDVIVCPFCAADLREDKPEERVGTALNAGARLLYGQQISQDLPLFPSSSLPPTIYPPHEERNDLNEDLDIMPTLPSDQSLTEIEPKNQFGATLLFSLGTQMFALGVLLLLFSQKGQLILKWDARFWFVYLFISIPLLIFGYRSL